jgi:hypothetical protein
MLRIRVPLILASGGAAAVNADAVQTTALPAQTFAGIVLVAAQATQTSALPNQVATTTISGLYLRPIADISDGGWTTDTGGTSLYEAIDELTQNDADYVRSAENPTDDVMEVNIG